MKGTSNAFYVIIVVCAYLFAVAILATLVVGLFVMPDERTSSDVYYEDYGLNWEHVISAEESEMFEAPKELKENDHTNSTIIRKTAINSGFETKYLTFNSAMQDIQVYINDELRYVYNTKNTRMFSGFSADITTFVPIYPSDNGKMITVIFTGNNKYSGKISEIGIGSQLGIARRVMEAEYYTILGAMILFVMGILSMILGVFIKLVYKRQASIGYLGLSVFFAGLWMIAESDARQFLVANVSLLANLVYLCIMIMPISFALYLNAVQKNRYRIFYMMISMLNIVETVISVVLQLNGVTAFYESLRYSFLLVGMDMIVYVITVVPDIKHGYVKAYWLEFIGIVGGICAGLYTLHRYYTSPIELKGFTLCGGLLFVTLMAYFRAFKEVLGLERSVHAANQAQEASTEFLSRMSHEMRTPINAILGMNKMILKECTDSNILEYSRDVNAAGNYLLSVVDEVLDLSKVRSGNIEINVEEYDLMDMIRECYLLIIPRSKASRIGFSVEVNDVLPSKLYGDKDRVVQIITNLLGNAVKFTPEGHISLDVNGKISGGRLMLTITVSDTGVGIIPEQIPYLFNSFSQIGTAEEGHVEGAGLGLAISKQFLDLMEGTIEVESAPGKGSTFTVVIPQGIAAVEPCGTFSLGPNGDRRIADREIKYRLAGKILVVDDVAINLRVFAMLLKNTDVKVDMAKSGNEALEKIKNTKYDIIFLDHLMPAMDGMELKVEIERLEDNPNKDTPIIMQTANAVVGAREEYLEHGFADYIAKPIKEEVLLAMLKKYLFE